MTDAAGHILQKTENGKTQNYFYANGKPLGSSGALSAADFDFNYTPVSAQYPASTPGSYVVSAGDTLRGIALAVFGDAQLWYLIADANGLKSDADLTAGRNLTIPNKVTNLRNAADTYKPYAPGAIIGDTTPTLPDPPPPPPIYSSSGGGGGGCGGFGAILTVIIIVVAIVTINPELIPEALAASEGAAATASYGVCAAPATLGELMVNGMLVNAATQGASMALGLQDEFSWSGLALSAVSAGVGGALPGAEAFGGGMGGMIARAATGSLITQGIGVATGLQEHFSWSSVAASAIGAGLNTALANSGVGQALTKSFGDPVGSSLVGALASGTAHALVFGGKANWANVAADAFGNVMANSIGQGLTAVGGAEQGAALDTAEADSERYAGGGLSMPVGTDNPLGLNFASMQESRYSSPPDYLPMEGLKLPMSEGGGYARDVGIVGREGVQGAWGIAKSLTSPAASNAEVNRVKNQLLTLNPELADGVRAGQRYYVPSADTAENLSLAGAADGVYGAQRAAQVAMTSNADAPQASSIYDQNGMRIGPTVARLQAGVGQAGVGFSPFAIAGQTVDWGDQWNQNTHDLTDTMSDPVKYAKNGLLAFAKIPGAQILFSAGALQTTRLIGVGAAESLKDAQGIFVSQNGKTALALGESASKYGNYIKGLGYIGTAVTILEETRYVAVASEGQHVQAWMASGINVFGNAAATTVGFVGGAFAGAFTGPAAPVAVPVLATFGGGTGSTVYREGIAPLVRHAFGVPDPLRKGWY